MNKKSNLTDFITTGGIFLGLALVGFIMFTVLDGFSDGIQASGIANDTSVVNLTGFVDTSNVKIASSIDWGILFMAVVFIIFSYIASTKIPTDNKNIAIVLIFAFIFFIIAMIISNVFGGMMDNSAMANYINLYMPITKFFLRYLPFYGLIYDFIVLVGFFGKREGTI